ncbi:ATP-binding protein [Promicromonospora sp. NPDC057138]|uniref:ATP-binding protein n=1 Tax=Promicromonospora sp. NPDC057138 TaxID=3346031 RepID=UPI00362BF8ED
MARIPQSPVGKILPRRAHDLVQEAMADTRVVLVNGPRQSGKSTLVGQIATSRGMTLFTLDDPKVREAARADESGFVRRAPTMVIDEIQRMPELLLPIKAAVDVDFVPGRFLLTGSARVLGLRALPDTLVGRMETIELWPLSQGEIDGAPDGFVDAAFALGPDLEHRSDEDIDGYIARIVRGGFPEAVARTGRRRAQFLKGYVGDLVNRDVVQLSEIERGPQMRALIDMLAVRSGNLLVPGKLASDLEISQHTVQSYLYLLEEVYLIKRIPALIRNLGTRTTHTQKVAMADSGIAAALLSQDEASLRRIGSPLGGLLEGFVAMEIARQLSWSETDAEMFHYRTKDQVEVDVVLQNRRREVVGVEVKASATPKAEDFRGLRHLAERLGDDFLAGYVLYTGDETLSFGPKLRALPISAVWQVAKP